MVVENDKIKEREKEKRRRVSYGGRWRRRGGGERVLWAGKTGRGVENFAQNYDRKILRGKVLLEKPGLTFWSRSYVLKFSTPCIQSVNNTGTKQVRIMKQTGLKREKRRVYTMFKIFSTCIC